MTPHEHSLWDLLSLLMKTSWQKTLSTAVAVGESCTQSHLDTWEPASTTTAWVCWHQQSTLGLCSGVWQELMMQGKVLFIHFPWPCHSGVSKGWTKWPSSWFVFVFNRVTIIENCDAIFISLKTFLNLELKPIEYVSTCCQVPEYKTLIYCFLFFTLAYFINNIKGLYWSLLHSLSHFLLHLIWKGCWRLFRDYSWQLILICETLNFHKLFVPFFCPLLYFSKYHAISVSVVTFKDPKQLENWHIIDAANEV